MSSPRITAPSELEESHPSGAATGSFLGLAAFFIGLAPALERFIPLEIGQLTPWFLVACGFATLGYWIGVTDGVLRTYLRWIVPFVVWAVVSVLAAGVLGSLKSSGGNLVWLLLVPGIATMCLDERRLKALLLGVVTGASVLLAVVAWRWARGASILDEGYLQLLGLNRNVIDATIVWLIPTVLWSKTISLPRVARLAFLALSILWLVSSEGRTGFIAGLMVPIVYLLLKPATAVNRAVRFGMVALLGSLLYAALTTTPIPGLPATERIVRYNTAERTEADKIRLLLNEKSLALAKKHPITGVGYNQYRGKYDPVIEKGTSEHIREDALTLPAHNTYYELMATTGFPGFLFFAGAFLVPLLAGIRTSWDPDVRALTAGFVIVLFCMVFHTFYGATIAVSGALVLAAVARARRRAAHELTPAAVRPS